MLLFILLGLSLPRILGAVASRPPLALGVEAAVIILTVVLVRLLWLGAVAARLRLVHRLLGGQDSYPPWKATAVISWAGRRGADALVIALALGSTLYC
jgi:CPA1 family monovalent cation:H+ antiporter